jgi:hypothetical protein
MRGKSTKLDYFGGYMQETKLGDFFCTKKSAAGRRPQPLRRYYVAYTQFHMDYRISVESLGHKETIDLRRFAFEGQLCHRNAILLMMVFLAADASSSYSQDR